MQPIYCINFSYNLVALSKFFMTKLVLLKIWTGARRSLFKSKDDFRKSHSDACNFNIVLISSVLLSLSCNVVNPT